MEWTLSRKETHFKETCCHLLGIECQDKAQQWGGGVRQWKLEEEIPEKPSRKSGVF
jgi:hypothetical protein